MNANKGTKANLAHVVWIGGATDAGKSTVATQMAEQHGFAVYHYDRYDVPHHKILAQTNPLYQTALTASLDERWVHTAPEDLFDRWQRTIYDRFPLVVDNLLALSHNQIVIAEGFGFTPQLLQPLLSHPTQAIWIVPSDRFKQVSFTRRGKPGFAPKTSDPSQARQNLFTRDKLITAHYRQQCTQFTGKLVEVDIDHSIDDMVNLVVSHLWAYIATHVDGIS